MYASFPEVDRKKNLHAIIDTLVDCELYLGNIINKVPIKQQVNRFFNEKTFGTFEQMRVEMELRYKA